MELEDDIAVLGEASTGSSAIEWIRGMPVDVILMDVRMPDKDGIEATAEIVKIRPETKVLMLTVVEDQTTLLKAVLAGARGYLVYGQFTPEGLTEAIRAVASGGGTTIPNVAPQMLDQIWNSVTRVHNIAELESREPLTAREEEILGLIAAGKGNPEIAITLSIEEKTVKNHINNIYSKLQIKSRYEAISYMFRRAV